MTGVLQPQATSHDTDRHATTDQLRRYFPPDALVLRLPLIILRLSILRPSFSDLSTAVSPGSELL